MSRATDYLEQLGSDRRIVEPSVVDAIIGLGMVLDERLGQTHNVAIRIQMTLEELLAEVRHIRVAPAPAEPDEDQEPDIDDEPPPDYGPPGSDAVITEWP
jgi:hypothetical protein